MNDLFLRALPVVLLLNISPVALLARLNADSSAPLLVQPSGVQSEMRSETQLPRLTGLYDPDEYAGDVIRYVRFHDRERRAELYQITQTKAGDLARVDVVKARFGDEGGYNIYERKSGSMSRMEQGRLASAVLRAILSPSELNSYSPENLGAGTQCADVPDAQIVVRLNNAAQMLFRRNTGCIDVLPTLNAGEIIANSVQAVTEPFASR